MVVMFGLGKWDLDAMGYRRHTEAVFVLVQLVCLGLIGLLYNKITAMVDDGAKINVPEVKQFGQVVAPATTQTTKEYDMGKLREQAKQAIMGFVILGGVYYKWEYLMPLVLQIVMTPLQLFESPLFQLHIMGKDEKRPFPAPNPFGLPSAPEAPSAAVADKKKKESGKAEGKKDS
eukprot:SRR837773.10988.p2 GENE.SRR837773.10988~~SRR837773.10988.p2  ORF type:complete len:187 (+),score=101.17 SRR837773.10988:39-563(+)